ncbi:MAG: hypothetical protein AAF962_11000 [Actinomycetota bacterium]
MTTRPPTRRRAARAPGLAALALALLLAACGDDGPETTTDAPEPTVTTPSPDDTEPSEDPEDALGPPIEVAVGFEGLTEAEGRELAESEGRPFRIARSDEEVFALTMDLVPNRVTVELDDGVITLAVLG